MTTKLTRLTFNVTEETRVLLAKIAARRMERQGRKVSMTSVLEGAIHAIARREGLLPRKDGR